MQGKRTLAGIRWPDHTGRQVAVIVYLHLIAALAYWVTR